MFERLLQFNVVAWRIIFFTILIITLALNVKLITERYLEECFYLLSTSSFVIAIIMAKIFKLKGFKLELAELNKNINESKKIIRQSGFGIFRYGKFNNTVLNQADSNSSLLEIITEPLAWTLCIALFAGLFLTTPYLEFDLNDFGKVSQLILLTLLQVAMLSFAILGIGISINKKIKGH